MNGPHTVSVVGPTYFALFTGNGGKTVIRSVALFTLRVRKKIFQAACTRCRI